MLPHPTADPKMSLDATPQPPIKASMPRQQLPQLVATEPSSAAERRYAKLSVSTNAAKICCKFLFSEQHIYNDMGIGYIISHPITTTQLRYMHLYIHVTKETPFPEWDTFIKDLTRDFSPSLSHDTLGDMAFP
jgi:hypothetical protein